MLSARVRWRVAYNDCGVPVGDLGVVVEGCLANRLLAGLQEVLDVYQHRMFPDSRCGRSARAAGWEAVKRPVGVSKSSGACRDVRLTAIVVSAGMDMDVNASVVILRRCDVWYAAGGGDDVVDKDYPCCRVVNVC